MTNTERLLELFTKSTQGRWKSRYNDPDYDEPPVSCSDALFVDAPDGTCILEAECAEDAALIVAMQRALPALLAFVDSSRYIVNAHKEKRLPDSEDWRIFLKHFANLEKEQP